jgi:hypothetical protein
MLVTHFGKRFVVIFEIDGFHELLLRVIAAACRLNHLILDLHLRNLLNFANSNVFEFFWVIVVFLTELALGLDDLCLKWSDAGVFLLGLWWRFHNFFYFESLIEDLVDAMKI